jgi:hypothetical protein
VDVSGRPQTWWGNGKRLPAQGNPGGASKALERGQGEEPPIRTEDERCLFIANKVSGRLAIGDKREIEKATWRKPRGVRLTPTSRYIRDKLFPKRG